MNRLRDMDTHEPAFRRGVEVLRETPPTPQVPAMKQRVWRSLRRAQATAAPGGFRTLVVKLAIVTIVCLGAGTAGAVITRRWIVPALDDVQSATPPSTPLPARVVEAAIPAPTPAATATETVDEHRISKSPSRSAPKKPASALPSAAAVARERTEVLDALVALRREHDPVRAGGLLTRYLAAHPHGALREEALVLAIEAADARSDIASAQQLAQTYQTEFPAGRFLTFARGHTGGRTTH